MTATPVLNEVTHSSIDLGVVFSAEYGGLTVVAHGDDRIECDGLHSVEGEALRLHTQDTVLFWRTADDPRRGVILGRVGPSHAPPTPAVEQTVASARPETLLLEAEQSLTLRVGDGSITIRADGKILIKGKDLVSHAQRVNRIKGGSVAIN